MRAASAPVNIPEFRADHPFLFLIQERRVTAPAGEAWEGFARRNPDLLTWKPSILDRYYSRETLQSELARRVFLLPERPASLAGLGGSEARPT